MKIVKKSTENCHFYSREKLLYIAWARLRNDITQIVVSVKAGSYGLSTHFRHFSVTSLQGNKFTVVLGGRSFTTKT